MSRIAGVPVRWSWLNAFAKSPAHALHAATTSRDATAAMKLGSAGHAAAFEPHRIVIYPGRRAGKAWETFRDAQDPDAVIVNEREVTLARGMADALRAADAVRTHPETGESLPLLFGAGVLLEQRIEWTRDGRACSSTPDARNPGKWIADLKCARSSDPARYPRDAARYGYQAQLVMYDEADAAERTGDYRNGTCELYSVVVEPTPPHVVTTYRLRASAVSSGRRTLAAWWERLNACERYDEWPGYSQSVCDFEVDDPLAVLDGFEADDDENQTKEWSAGE